LPATFATTYVASHLTVTSIGAIHQKNFAGRQPEITVRSIPSGTSTTKVQLFSKTRAGKNAR